MSAFLKSSLCSGQRPDGVLPVRHVPRPDLVARLLRSRSVARFIVAPDGFGKTAVAAEYAETVFGFLRIFWVNGRSPCFLRDLDAGVIAEGMALVAPTARLAVFDDVPPLDAVRAERFARLADQLLSEEVEVLVTCTPSADAYGSLQRDRLLLGAADLLLTEEEAALSPTGEPLAPMPDRASERVACLRWGEDGQRTLARGIRREELPADMLLMLMVTCLLGEGSLDDLAEFVPARRCDELAAALEAGYPFAGVEPDERAYRAASLDVAALSLAVLPSMDALAAASVSGERDALVSSLADVLVARGACRRATEAMAALASRPGCGTWLAARGWDIACAGHGRAARTLYDAVWHRAQPARPALNAAAGWASASLGDDVTAAVMGRRALASAAASPAARLHGATLLMACGEPEEAAQGRQAAPALLARPDAPAPGSPPALLAQVALALGEGALEGARAWERAQAQAGPAGADDAALLMAAGWVSAAAAEEALEVPDEAASSAAWASERLEALASAGETLGWAALVAGRGLETLVRGRPALRRLLPSAALTGALRAAEARDREERSAYRRERAAAERRADAWRRAHPDPFREERPRAALAPAARPVPPTLHVDLFGGLTVRLGDDPVSDRALSKRKVKTLLAILVLRRGSELPRDKLAEALWPESDAAAARKNLSSVWSALARALSVDGFCPYLLGDEHGCRLDGRLVDSDVARFEALCRKLLFSHARLDGWEELYAQVCGPYAEELLPCEHDSSLVDALRVRYRVELADALVAASERLAEAGEVRGALWFAREALRRDSSREDAYVAQMQAQMAAGQRAAALETYFACRAYLAEELGIDPSARIVELYRSIVEEEVEV